MRTIVGIIYALYIFVVVWQILGACQCSHEELW